METSHLGTSGLQVSRLCLGTMMFGKEATDKAAADIVAYARDAGVNFIDTADQYNKGKSERVLGKLIKKDRDFWVLATKVGNHFGPAINDGGLNRKWIMKAAESSLSRLKTDYIDLYYLHLDDPDTPVEETLSTLDDLMRAGKVRYWGVSNYRAWRIAEFAQTAEAMGMAGPVVCQPYYNAMNRMPEVEILPCCERFGIGVVPYSPLARGVLTGKYDPDAKPAKGTRAGRNDPRLMETEFRRESMLAAREIAAHAKASGTNPIAFAVQWVLNNQIVDSVLAGPRTLSHWKGYVDAMSYAFTAEDEALIDRLVPKGHPSTPGYSDPRYPICGRPTWTGEDF